MRNYPQIILPVLFCDFWFLCAILTATFCPLVHACCVQNTPNDCVTETDVFDTTAAQEYYRVFLQSMSYAGNISGDFHAV